MRKIDLRRHLHLTAAIVVSLVFLVAGCSSDSSDTNARSSPTDSVATEDGNTDGPIEGSIVVSAAASLTDPFTTIKDDFVRQNPKADVSINFGSSGQLSAQIQEGAPADVAAFADSTPMANLNDAGLLAGPPKVFARNQLVMVTKPDNPTGIKTLVDLADAGTVALCVETAPCGEFANQVLTTAGVTISTGNITRGTDVKSTLTAVTEGDAVAGIVYTTDAASVKGQVATVEIAEVGNVVAIYPIAVVKATKDAKLAGAFNAYVLSDEGLAVLRKAGFLAP